MADIVGQEIKFIRLNEHDLIGRCMQVGFFEGHVISKAVELMKNAEPGIVLDIGANMGSFSIPLAYYNPNFHFVCFEPQRMVYNQLCGNVAINYLNNVEPYNFGLSTESKSLIVQVPDYRLETNIGAFSLDDEVRSKEDYLCKTKGMQEQIYLRTLDSIMIEHIRLIKIDVEGMELDVIKGGLETLKKNGYPPILFESWESRDWFLPRRQELFSFLESLGYEVTSMGEDNFAVYKGEVNE